MSTMLRTTNPEAAGDEAHDRRRPYLGQSVIFHSRPGEWRNGRTTAIAWVAYVEDDDHVDVLISFDADDFIMRRKIPRKTDQNNVNCWSFNEWDQTHYMVAAPTPLTEDIKAELRRQIDHLHEVVQKIDKRTAKK